MKKFLALLLAIMMVLTLTACGSKTEEPTAGGDESNVTEITLWTYPIGGWGNQDTVNELIKGFEAANEAIGTLVLKFDSQERIEEILGNQNEYVRVILK